MADASIERSGPEQAFVRRMEEVEMPRPAIRSFLYQLGKLNAGDDGLIPSQSIEGVFDAPDFDSLGGYCDSGSHELSRVATIKLNGGLGTSMGLNEAKSLLPIRDGLTFLDLIVRQVLSLRERSASQHPLLLMNSYRTERASMDLLSRYPDLASQEVALSFLQHRVPRVDASTMAPVELPERPELEWCPPGHGDLYLALSTSGLLDAMMHAGVRFAFVSNADNLGAIVSTRILGYMDEHDLDFVMEVADRTEADRKGGHLCRLPNGRFGLREIAQCPPDEIERFQDTQEYSLFNTNNIWLRLAGVRRLLDENQGILPLPTIVNRKPVDSSDPHSAQSIQLETAMGAAISLFDRAAAVRVPRRRFSPVKTTNDLLAVRSDAYRLQDDHRLSLHPELAQPPNIDLDSRYYKLIDDFEARFPYGPPSLYRCETLAIAGDVLFGRHVRIEGKTHLRATNQQASVADGRTVSGSIDLD